MTTMVYRYDMRGGPVAGAEDIEHQMRATHRYRNQLVEIERGRRAAERSALAEHLGLQWLEWGASVAAEDLDRAIAAVKTPRQRDRRRSEPATARVAVREARTERLRIFGSGPHLRETLGPRRTPTRRGPDIADSPPSLSHRR